MIGTWCIEENVPLLHNDRDYHFMEQHLGLKNAIRIAQLDWRLLGNPLCPCQTFQVNRPDEPLFHRPFFVLCRLPLRLRPQRPA